MRNSTVSTCHSLKLVPLARLSRFVKIKSRVAITVVAGEYSAGEVPGSVRISSGSDSGLIKKTIYFERSDVSAASMELFERYRNCRLIATYVDESGNRRVAGSPDWPLSLDYTIGDGVFSVTLQGEDIAPDAFLMD